MRLALQAVRDGLRPGRRHELPRGQRPRYVCGIVPACTQSFAVTVPLLNHAMWTAGCLRAQQVARSCVGAAAGKEGDRRASRCFTSGLRADDADAGVQPLRGDGDAGDHAAARHGHHDRVQPAEPLLFCLQECAGSRIFISGAGSLREHRVVTRTDIHAQKLKLHHV